MRLDRSAFPATLWIWRRLTSRLALWFYLLCATLVILFAAFIQIQAHLMRHRAEALPDIQQLELRKSTWADAQKVMNRWGAWGHYKGSCTPAECQYDIDIVDVTQKPIFPSQLIAPYRVTISKFGGRSALIHATFTVIDSFVWGKSFTAGVDVPADSFSKYGYTLIGNARSVSRFSPWNSLPQLALHREYVIGTPGGCEICLMVYTRFTPYANASDIQRLMDFDLSCITRWHPCRERQELMPQAWPQHLAEEDRVAERWNHSKCDYPIDLLAREAQNAAVVDVVSSRTEQRSGDNLRILKLRLVERIKGAQFWQVNTEESLSFQDADSETYYNAPRNLAPGSRIVLLFSNTRGQTKNHPGIDIEECGLIPFTSQNLAEVQQGAHQDFRSMRPSADQHGEPW